MWSSLNSITCYLKWLMILKHSTMKILTPADKRKIWEDICDEIIAIRQREAHIDVTDHLQNNERAATAARTLPVAMPKKIKVV